MLTYFYNTNSGWWKKLLTLITHHATQQITKKKIRSGNDKLCNWTYQTLIFSNNSSASNPVRLLFWRSLWKFIEWKPQVRIRSCAQICEIPNVQESYEEELKKPKRPSDCSRMELEKTGIEISENSHKQSVVLIAKALSRS